MGAHRSGTNFVQNLIEQKIGYPMTEKNGNDETSIVWKHHYPSPENIKKMNMKCFFVIRHPMKWLNSVVKFNAGLWKNKSLYSDDVNDLTVKYIVKANKICLLSIPKLINHWNQWYSYPNLFPMYKYHDILKNPEIILKDYKLPAFLEHSRNWDKNDTELELNLDYLPNLSDAQKDYALDNFKWELYN